MTLLKVDARIDGFKLKSEDKTLRHTIRTRYINLDHIEMIYEDEVVLYRDGRPVLKDGKTVYETVTRIRLTHQRETTLYEHKEIKEVTENITHMFEYEVLQPMSDVIDAINEALPDMCVCDTTEDKPEKPDTPEKE